MLRRRSVVPAVVATSAALATTANAWKPFAREGAGSILSFGSGLVTSEFPILAAGSQVLGLAGLAARGHVRGRTGLGLAAATAGSVATLVALDREAKRSGDVLERSLVDGLGADYRSYLGAYRASPLGTPLTKRDVRVRLRGDRKRLAAAKDLSYGDAGKRNRLDVWHREDLPKDAKAPVLLQIHGGGWMTGSKETQGVPLMKHMAEQGWVCVAINYRLSPRATWPDHIVDVKRAIGWIKEHIAEHGGDPDFIAITGGSAGGHLTALAALTPNDPAFQPGFESVDTTLQAAVPFYGVYDWVNRDATGRLDMERLLAERIMKTKLEEDRERWEQASPMSHVGPQAPPMFCLHGTNDSLVPVGQARAFVRMLRSTSDRPVVYAELPRAQHAFEVFGSVRAAHSSRAAARFLSFVRASHETVVAPVASVATTPAPPMTPPRRRAVVPSTPGSRATGTATVRGPGVPR